MKQILFIAFAALFSLGSLFAQQTITGTVTDVEGEPLIGATVLVQGSTTGTITDFNGRYRIVASGDDVLVLTYVGYMTEEVPIEGRSEINVVMQIDALRFDEVVVTEFGITRERKSLSYSVQDVDGDVLSRAGTPNVTNALQGKIAGVQVNQSSGMPGASSLIRVRGSNSFNLGNQPLYVIDGVPIASGASFAGGVSGTDYSSRALDLNVEDIESITVLKGGSAAALYGMRASNGVVVITTKKGTRGIKRPQITLSQSVSFDEVSRLPDLQNTYAQGAGGAFSTGASTSWGPRVEDLDDPSINPRANGDGTYTNLVGQDVTPQKYDNVSPIFRTGITSTSNLGINGSIEDRGSYSFSMGYTDQSGIIRTTGMDRVNLRLGSEYSITDQIRTGFDISVVKTDIDKLAGGSNLSNTLFTTYWAPISYDLWGLPYATADNPYAQIHYRGAMDNPRWGLENNSFNENITRTYGSVFFEYQPLEWLTARYQLGLDGFTENHKEIYGLGSGDTGGRSTSWTIGEDENGDPIPLSTGTPSGGQITDFKRDYRQVSSSFLLLINQRFGDDFTLDAILGNEIVDIQSDAFLNVGSGIEIGGFNNINNTSDQNITNSRSTSRTIGNFANATLGWRSTLFLNASVRTDIVSNMPSGNRTFTYPSVGVGFVFSELLDLPANSFFNFGKIRASYAEVGQAGPLYVTTTPFVLSEVGTGFTTDGISFPFGGVTAFQETNALGNPNLRPQNTKSLELGLQLQFFRNRLGLDITYFTDNTVDQIFRVPVASSTGYSTALQNAGELEGKGWEISLTGTPVQSNKFSWDVAVNFTKVDNQVISLAEGVENIFLGGFVEPNVRAQAGSSYPIIFGSKFLRDDSGNIVYDSRQFLASGNSNPRFGMPIADPDLGPIGDVNPDFEIGISNTFNYGPLSVFAHIDMREGGSAYSGNTKLQKLYGMDVVTEDRETPVIPDGVKGYLDGDGQLVVEGENDISILRGQAFWDTYMDAIDESNVYSTSFFRLREVGASYTFGRKLGPLRGFTLFASARNLLLISDYPNFDPETSVGGASNFQGLEYVNLPQSKSYLVGFRANF